MSYPADEQWALALALTPEIDLHAVRACGQDPAAIIHLDDSELSRFSSTDNTDELKPKLRQAFAEAEKELTLGQQHRYRILTPLSADYPAPLLDMPAPPRMVSVLGNASLLPQRSLAIVGTRRCTPYGRDMTRRIVSELATTCPPVTIISGLALGIDAAAHEAALSEGLPTIACLAHGFHTIYPATHRLLARKIIETGGALVSQYPFQTSPWRGNFLERNGVIAALAHATLVVETAHKGGSLNTALHARHMQRPVFALPGRATDEASTGCNHLIASQKASLTLSASDIISHMGWESTTSSRPQERQQELFRETSPQEKAVLDVLSQSADPMLADEIAHTLGLPIFRLLPLLSDMEFDGLLLLHPGSRYSRR